MFGNGYVPYNVIIGPGYQVYSTGSGFNETASRNTIDDAIANFQFYPKNIITDQRFATNSEFILDLSGVFHNETGQQIVYTVYNNSDPLILDTAISGSELTTVTSNIMGNTDLTIKGAAGTNEAFFKFSIETYNPNLTEAVFQNFDSSWPPAEWTLKTTGAGWIQSSYSSVSGSFSACHADDSGAQNDWIYSPKVMITEQSMLTFWQKGLYTSYYESHSIAYSKDGNRFTLLYADLPVSTNWEQVFIDLSSLAGQEVFIGFNYQGDYSDVWLVDDVRVWTYTGIEDQNIAKDTKLFQNYPNPFNPSTEISFSLNSELSVKLSVYNSKGELVANIFEGSLKRGIHKYIFNAEKLNSGIYFYSLEYDKRRLINKMLLVK
ncbi:MAG: T9SS type A sorting domain-containing protein [Candidatus Delongbacteria bacterium]|nr:T9SS type A sorting domain-containing protein [Candidatus Delongbacteria bacterium]MCG2759947.1 T9SS type A sorting domain-containing protein [Candidatus Delongbacteria bacterium]